MNDQARTFNPMAGNPLQSRDDVVRAIRDLYLPLSPYYSAGGARVRLDMAAAHFDRAAADLEGFSRPLWGLAPLAAGGGADFVDWERIRRGLTNGTDPQHSEYWGLPGPRDQRLVELAAIGFALSLIPDILWRPQSTTAKSHIAAYLQHAYVQFFGANNWMFFRVMIGLGLHAIGEALDPAPTEDYLDKLDALYLGDGWYRDGPSRRADHYIGFAMNYYGLLYARLANDAARADVYRQRAASFASDFVRWFADDGATLPFGRSLTYRFGCGGFWAALAFADFPALPWGQIKGLILRHLRWWSRQPIAHRDGVLSIGYAYPNLHMCESYNSAGSPYWAFKVFAFMALPADHPFWTTPEETLPAATEAVTQVHPGMIVFNLPGDVITLTGGQEERQVWLRKATEKYCKFAYSARYGFSVETDEYQFDGASFDNMLAFSDDGRHFRVREGNRLARISNGLLYARWCPAEGIEVETWSLPATPWHIRVHRIHNSSSKAFHIIEGGFAIARPDGGAGGPAIEQKGAAAIATDSDFSGICDLGSSVARRGRVLAALPNTNLINAKSTVPQLIGEIATGESVLISAILAIGNASAGRNAWNLPPSVPSIDELEAMIRTHGCDVSTFALAERDA